ncbi:hypothetical protein C8R45DRAFT_933510 [Mycena sanguinolenta]|nr:hypothetical protein C8R45DRAFT_933510 [Mycena sanguinolenta]
MSLTCPRHNRSFYLASTQLTLKTRALGTSGTGGTQPLLLIYHDIARLISQNRLTSLHLEGTPECTAVWRNVRSVIHRTGPSEITTNVVTQDLCDYLNSYSGLRKLTLKFPDGGNASESNRLADTFFATVLPLHAESLTEFSCLSACESRFSFETHNVTVISLLHKLTRLEMSINQADVVPVLTLLLRAALGFPALRSLTIIPTEMECTPGAQWFGNEIANHRAVNLAIGEAVMAFRTNVPSLAIVHAVYNIYHLRPRHLRVEEGHSEALGYEKTGSWWR